MNAVEIKNLCVSYENMVVLEDINLEIKSGEYNIILGPNGGGKSTLVKSILGLVPFNKGSIKIYGENNNYSDVAYVPQLNKVDKNFPMSVKKFVLTGTMDRKSYKPFFKYSKKDIEVAENALKFTKIHKLKDRNLNELSGGQFAKMLISRALAGNAKLIILDEPTASVDPASRTEIYALLKDLKRTHTLLFVTHDLIAVDENVDSIICLNRKLVYHGKAEFSQDIVDRTYDCPVDLIAHGVAHRVLRKHDDGGDI